MTPNGVVGKVTRKPTGLKLRGFGDVSNKSLKILLTGSIEMPNPYAIRHLRCASGERIVLLTDATSGLPISEPALYTLRNLRTKHLAVNTMEAHLRAIMLFLLVSRTRKIDLINRLRESRILSLSEIENIVSKCRLQLKDVIAEYEGSLEKKVSPAFREDYLLRKSKPDARKIASSSHDRVSYIRDYIDDLVSRKMGGLDIDAVDYLKLEKQRERVYKTFTSLMPVRRHSKGRLSMTESQLHQIWEILEPDSTSNPFCGYFSRKRNFLLVQWFILLGLRRDELRGVRIQDICWTSKMVKILRMQDSLTDPRRKEARAKTIEGLVPLSDDMLSQTHAYLTDPKLRPAHANGSHDFVFVSTNGAPISPGAIDYLFKRLRTSSSTLPPNLCAQLCRTTTNDILSREFDKQQISSTDEAARRRTLMRRSPNSIMPDYYNRRRIVEKANEASLSTQASQFAKRKSK